VRDHSLVLRKAIVAALRANAGVRALVDNRVYGVTVAKDMPTWPSDDNPAYVKMGLPTVGPSEPSGINGSDIRVAVHGFARGPSEDLAVMLSNAIVEALDKQAIAMSGGISLRELRCISSQTVPDAGSPSDFHCIVQLAALTAEPA
jgi:hypothetical protein